MPAGAFCGGLIPSLRFHRPLGAGLGGLQELRCQRSTQVPLRPQDAFQEEYYRTGIFPETPMVPPRRPWTLLNWLFWASLLLYPFFRFVVSMVSSGSSLTLAGFVLVFFVGKWLVVQVEGAQLSGCGVR